jgi:hypothetical protein
LLLFAKEVAVSSNSVFALVSSESLEATSF